VTRHSPKDPAFNKIIREEVEGNLLQERIIFIDHDNHVREAVYPPEFHTGELQVVRQRMENQGVLKAVVHLAANVPGGPKTSNPRTTLVQYLPDGQFYYREWRPPQSGWVGDGDQDRLKPLQDQFQKLFGDEEGEEEETPGE
jgi:hypothetical protein